METNIYRPVPTHLLLRRAYLCQLSPVRTDACGVQMFNTTKCSDPVFADAGAEDPRRATLIADVFADFKRGCLQNRNTHPPRVTPKMEKPKIGRPPRRPRFQYHIGH